MLKLRIILFYELDVLYVLDIHIVCIRYSQVDSLQQFRSLRNKIFVCILIFQVFFRHSVLVAREISICKVLMIIKIVQGTNDYFPH